VLIGQGNTEGLDLLGQTLMTDFVLGLVLRVLSLATTAVTHAAGFLQLDQHEGSPIPNPVSIGKAAQGTWLPVDCSTCTSRVILPAEVAVR
jgi:hypothetical protein